MNDKTDGNIRAIEIEDLLAIKAIIDANQLFPSNMLDEMMSDYFGDENSRDLWFTYDNGKPLAVAYCAPEKLTEGTWNLYLIAVHPDYQRLGYGTSMLHYVEEKLAYLGERILLVETSGLESFKNTREFYLKCGYEKEARIREFYQAGEDKIVFRKLLIN